MPAPTFVDPAFPPALEAIIMRALEVDASERYQNCDHMFRDLDAFMTESRLTCTPRKISAFMAEMFGEGAPAEVDYDGQYDDLVDDALDFDAFDSMVASPEDETPAWAKDFESGDAKPTPSRRSMTIGNLDALVADVASGDSGSHPVRDDSGAHKRTPSRPSGDTSVRDPSGKRRQVRASSGPRRRAPTSSSRALTTGSRARATASRPRVNTLNTGALDTNMAGDAFGRGVMSQQSRGTSPLVWFAVVVILGVLGYFAWTIMSSK